MPGNNLQSSKRDNISPNTTNSTSLRVGERNRKPSLKAVEAKENLLGLRATTKIVTTSTVISPAQNTFANAGRASLVTTNSSDGTPVVTASIKDTGKENPEETESQELNQEQECAPCQPRFPTPALINGKEFAKLTGDQKMGNILSVVSLLSKKMEEIDLAVNHNTGGLEARVCLAQAQADDNSGSMAQMIKVTNQAKTWMADTRELTEGIDFKFNENKQKIEDLEEKMSKLAEENETIKGIIYRHSVKLESMNEK